MPDVAFILDAGPAGASRHPVARLGAYTDPRYGKFRITQADYESWVRNLAAFGGKIPIDYDHAADRPGGSTEAAGWITSLNLDERDGSEFVIADIEWTPQGAEAVRDKRWQFVSPTFTASYKDEQGKDLGAALVGVALTNRPFLKKGMPAISLSAATGFAEPDPSDNPADMPDTTETTSIALAAGLPEDTAPEQIAEAVKALRDAQAPKLTLEEQAAADGKVILDAAQVASLQADAAAGRAADDQLRAQRFDTAFAAALTEGRVDAKPETRETWQSLYTATPDEAVKALSALPKIVPTTPSGTGHQAPDGEQGERTMLAQRVQQLRKDNPGLSHLDAALQANREMGEAA